MSGVAGGLVADSTASTTRTEDEGLIERLASGADEAALSELYDRYQALMYGIALRITHDPALAQDAVQEALMGAWRNAARYSPMRGSVRTWLASITHHRAIDILRRRRGTTPLPESEVGESSLTVPDVWLEVSRTLDRDTVRQAMAGLPDAQRETISLAYFDGLTQVEIADRTGVPLGTVKSRVRLGLAQMRRFLEGWT